MTQTNSQPSSTTGKGKKFFDRADEVADTGNWDFAIEMYVEGLAREPDNIERGHQPLREVALKRKAQGGKGPGIKEKLQHRAGKDPVRNLVHAEYLLAKQPGSTMYMEQALKAAKALDLPALANWIGQILLDEQRQSPKRNKRLLLVLTEAFHDIEEYGSAVQACEMARELSPNDSKLQEMLQDLSAKYTIKKGRYDQAEGDFTKSVADMERQKQLMRKDALVKDREYLTQQVRQTKKEYEESPTVAGKIAAHVEALLALEDESYENEAIQVLDKAHQDTGAYQHKMRIGDIRIRQMSRQRRETQAKGDNQAVAQLLRKQLAFELQEYADRVANYPTDLTLKYELGRRQLLAGQYDEAIAILQEAQRDPRRHVMAMNYLGQAFARKEWLQEAAETFEKVLKSEMPEERAKEIRYNLGDVMEKMGDLAASQEQFSIVAQTDYNYKDVRQRLEAVRQKVREQGGQPGEASGGP